MVVKFFLALVLFFFPFFSWSEVTLEPIIVEKEVSFRDFFLKEENLREFPSTSSESILDYSSSLDLRERESFGIQTDLSIRGSIFEDNKVLIEGIEVNDPQTGHFSLELPLPIEALQNIEINPNSQEINFEIREPPDRFFNYISFLGRHSLIGNSLSIGFPWKKLRGAFYLEQAKSKGAQPDTDFNLYKVCLSSFYEDETQKIDFLYAFLKKDFGADGFYASPKYMQEEEHIAQSFSYLNYLAKTEKFDFKLTPYFRRHLDKFILDRHNPSFYTNYHTTYIYGVNSQLRPKDLGVSYNLGFRVEKINSTTLGNRQRKKVFFSLALLPQRIRRLLLKGGFSSVYYRPWGWLNIGDFSLSYLLGENFRVKLVFNRLYRAPSFTELFYSSPANKGNPNLEVQNLRVWEISLNSQRENYRFKIGLFLKDQRDSIDWVRDEESEPWRAKNVGKIEVRGVDLNLNFFLEEGLLKELSLSYTYLHLNNKKSYSHSKYLFNYLKNKWVGSLKIGSERFFLRPVFLLEEPIWGRLRLIVNFKINYKVNKNLSFFWEVLNLFNEEYEEVEEVNSQARVWKWGIEWRF